MATKNRFTSKISIASIMTLGLCAVLASTGCQTLSMPFAEAPLPAEATTAPTGTYQVAMTSLFGKTTLYEGAIQGPITVQTALEESGAIKKFRNMDIALIRMVEGTHQPLKMPVQYEHRSKEVSDQQNYAIHPNDRILVSPRSYNTFDKVIDSVVGNAF